MKTSLRVSKTLLAAITCVFCNYSTAQNCNNNISNLRVRNSSTIALYKTWNVYLYKPTFYKVPSLYTLAGTDTVNISNTCAVWSVGNNTIASVSNGVVTAKNTGSTTLTATINNQSVTIPMVVNAEVRPLEYESNLDPFLTSPAANAIAQVPVVVICFIPTNDGININTTEAAFSPIPTQTVTELKKHMLKINKHTKFSLEEGSKFRGYGNPSAIPYVGYKIVDYIYVYEPVPRGFKDPGSASFFGDYNVILNRFNGKKYVDTMGVKEFWMLGYHNGEIVPVESNMSSPTTGDISNSYLFPDDLPIYSKTFVFYNYNYTREGNEATHNHGHQFESMIDYVARKQDGNTNLFTRNFRGYDGGSGPLGRVGDTHHPPNTRVDYDYNNSTLVASDILDWKPDGGTKTMVNNNTWAGIPYPWPQGTTPNIESNWYVLWMQSLPGYNNKIPYGVNKQMTNWWEFLSNWDSNTASIGLYKTAEAVCVAPTFLNNGQIVLNPTCGNSDGNITIQPTSGTAPFLYSINGGTTYVSGPNTGYTFLNLAAGTYQLSLKDANGCESDVVQRVLTATNCPPNCTPPTFLNNGSIALAPSCGNNDGNITIQPTSGTGPFMYSINGGSTYVTGPSGGYTFVNLGAGTYNMRLKDADGCESAVVQKVLSSINCPTCAPPTFLNNALISLAPTCGNNDGNITIQPTSGTAPFMYSINGGATYVTGGNAGFTFLNLGAGVYQLRLKDANGCESAIVERTLTAVNCPPCTPPTFLNDATIVLEASCGRNDGNISIIPTSGTAPFMYSINGGTTYVSGTNGGVTFSNLAAGTYRLRLKDAAGCESTIVERTVRNFYNCPGAITGNNPGLNSKVSAAGIESNKDVITTFPNPNRGQFKVLLQNFASPRAEVLVVDAKGAIIQKRSLNLDQNTITDFDLRGKARGMYYIRVVSSNGTKVSKVLIQ